jgi:Predicted Na+-dependent transporter
MTAISTILSIGFLPLNVLLYTRLTYPSDVLSTLNWTSLGISLVVVVCAIGTGLYTSRKSAKFQNGKKIRSIANKFGNLAGLGLILFTSLAPEGGRIELTGREPIFYYGTILPIILGLLCSILISSGANLKKPERVTVAVECVYQNTGIAMTSCLALFSGDDQQRALGVPFWYTGMQTCFVGVYCLMSWKLGWTKAPANENIVKVILQSYELNEDEVETGSSSVGVNREDENALRNVRNGGVVGGGRGGDSYDLELNHVESNSLSTNGEKKDVDTEDDKQSSDSFHVNSKEARQ